MSIYLYPMDYNLHYLIDIKDDADNIELNKIMNVLDRRISNYRNHQLFHLVPILYSLAFVSGLGVFAYKIFT